MIKIKTHKYGKMWEISLDIYIFYHLLQYYADPLIHHVSTLRRKPKGLFLSILWPYLYVAAASMSLTSNSKVIVSTGITLLRLATWICGWVCVFVCVCMCIYTCTHLHHLMRLFRRGSPPYKTFPTVSLSFPVSFYCRWVVHYNTRETSISICAIRTNNIFIFKLPKIQCNH